MDARTSPGLTLSPTYLPQDLMFPCKKLFWKLACVHEKISPFFYASYFFHCWGQIRHLAYDMGGKSKTTVRKITHDLSGLSGIVVAAESELAPRDQWSHSLCRGEIGNGKRISCLQIFRESLLWSRDEHFWFV